MEHKQTKKLYGRTNKRKNFVSQATVHYRREQLLQQIESQAKATSKKMGNNEWLKARSQERHTSPCIPMDDCDALPFMQPKEHHQISNSDKVHENIIRFAHKNLLDPVVKVSTSGKLKNTYLCLIVLNCIDFVNKKHKQNKQEFLLILDLNFIQ